MKVKIFNFDILFTLISCSSGSIYRELFNTISILLSDPKDISKDEINKIPYASCK